VFVPGGNVAVPHISMVPSGLVLNPGVGYAAKEFDVTPVTVIVPLVFVNPVLNTGVFVKSEYEPLVATVASPPTSAVVITIAPVRPLTDTTAALNAPVPVTFNPAPTDTIPVDVVVAIGKDAPLIVCTHGDHVLVENVNLRR
jgi:hypothetical protein